MKKNIIIILLISYCLIFISCKNNPIITITYYLDEAFSIVPNVIIMDYENKIKDLNIKNDLSKITNDLDRKFNVFNTQSLISKINNGSGVYEVEVDDEFLYVLKNAINTSKATTINDKTLYDISIFSVWQEWKFNENYYKYYNYSNAPTNDIVKRKLPLVNYENIILNEKNKTVFLKEKGMMIDLGSIVKGYAADKIYEYLYSLNLSNYLIDVGGNIITSGKNIGTSKNWKVGVLIPFSYNEEIGYIESLEEKETFVTSGIYERYIIEKNFETNEEKLYHHILNPLTGFPEDNELLSVTIITTNSIIADAYSTAIFLMGLEQGLDYLDKINELDAIFITKDKKIYLSNNLKNRFKISEEAIKYGYNLII